MSYTDSKELRILKDRIHTLEMALADTEAVEMTEAAQNAKLRERVAELEAERDGWFAINQDVIDDQRERLSEVESSRDLVQEQVRRVLEDRDVVLDDLRAKLAEVRHQWDEQILATEEANTLLAEAEKRVADAWDNVIPMKNREIEKQANRACQAEAQLSTLKEKLKVAREALKAQLDGTCPMTEDTFCDCKTCEKTRTALKQIGEE